MRHVQTRGGVALGVEVDHQHPVAVQGQRDRDVDDASGLSHAALLIRHAEHAHLRRPGHLDLAARVQDLHRALRLLRQWRVLRLAGIPDAGLNLGRRRSLASRRDDRVGTAGALVRRHRRRRFVNRRTRGSSIHHHGGLWHGWRRATTRLWRQAARDREAEAGAELPGNISRAGPLPTPAIGCVPMVSRETPSAYPLPRLGRPDSGPPYEELLCTVPPLSDVDSRHPPTPCGPGCRSRDARPAYGDDTDKAMGVSGHASSDTRRRSSQTEQSRSRPAAATDRTGQAEPQAIHIGLGHNA